MDAKNSTAKSIPILVEDGLIKKPEAVPEIRLCTRLEHMDPTVSSHSEWTGFSGKFNLGTGHQATPVYSILGPTEMQVGVWCGYGSWKVPIFLPEYSLQFTPYEAEEQRTVSRLTQVLDWVAELSGLYRRRALTISEKWGYNQLYWEFRPRQEVPDYLRYYQERGAEKKLFGIPPVREGSVALLQADWGDPTFTEVVIGMLNGEGVKPQFRYTIPSPAELSRLQADFQRIAESNGLVAKFDSDYFRATFLKS